MSQESRAGAGSGLMRIDLTDAIALDLDPASALDIQSLFVDGVDLSPRRAIPDDGDPRIDHALQGFLFTCGPDHIRHPVPIPGRSDGARYPLHGSLAGHAAHAIRHAVEDGVTTVSAEVPMRLAAGGAATLFRDWRFYHRQRRVELADRVVNAGSEAFAVMWMYHMNIAGRLFDPGLGFTGAAFGDDRLPWRFGTEPGAVRCLPAADGRLRFGPFAQLGGLTLNVDADARTLPFLQLWRNQKAPADVLGIEPVSHRLAARADLEAEGALLPLAPGDSRCWRLGFAFGRPGWHA